MGTSDIQRFAISAENYDPQIVKRMREMLVMPYMGYRLEIEDVWVAILFFVVRYDDGTRLTENWVRRHDRDGALDTTILTGDMAPEETYMLADLEQCAALMLLEQADENQSNK